MGTGLELDRHALRIERLRLALAALGQRLTADFVLQSAVVQLQEITVTCTGPNPARVAATPGQVMPMWRPGPPLKGPLFSCLSINLTPLTTLLSCSFQ